LMLAASLLGQACKATASRPPVGGRDSTPGSGLPRGGAT
jgi:hypothetical protein